MDRSSDLSEIWSVVSCGGTEDFKGNILHLYHPCSHTTAHDECKVCIMAPYNTGLS